jgi:hypothetical protein
MSRQAAVVTGAVILGISCITAWSMQARQQVPSAAFWFESVSYDASEAYAERLSGGIARAELSTIESIARAEVQAAFANSRLTFADSHHAMYRVRVVQNIRGQLKLPVAGVSRPLPGRRGFGAVSFVVTTNNAIAYAPAGAGRQTIIEAIGRGIGRTAVHEFAHQLVGSFALHNTTDRSSYEYADLRPEHFYGELHWNVALPRLQDRIGLRPAL